MAALRRIANLFRRNRVNDEIDAELQAHIDLRIDANVAAGMSPAEARRDALLRFGNPTATRERVASADAALGLAGVWRDIRYAARQLRKSPGFTITAITTLGLGVGINTACFSSMDAVVLRPLAVPDLHRVMTIAEQPSHGEYKPVALANYEDWVRQSHSFESLAVRTGADMSLTGAGDAAHVSAALTSGSFFTVLRTQAQLGRVFTDAECQPGRDSVALLNYGFWQRQFAADPTVLGRKFELDQRTYTIIGVMPKTMQYPSVADVYLPFAPTPQQLANRTEHNYLVVGRLRDGVSPQQAQAEMHTLAQHLAATYPITNKGWSVKVESLLDNINGDMTPLYYRLIMGGTLFVLLVVCANIANLQLARGVARRPEIAMRSALGARRSHIVRQLLTENLLLAAIGAALGIGIAWLYLDILLITMPASIARYIPGWSNTSLNGRALFFSLMLAAAAGIVAGIAPAVGALRVNVLDQLKAGSRGTTGGSRRRMRSVFAVAQISLAVALVVGAALMSKGMFSLLHLADDYHPANTLVFNVSLPEKRYDTKQKQATWYNQSLERLRALPGVTSAEVTDALPYSDNGWLQDLEIQDRAAVPGKFQSALHLAVSQGYFASLHIPIIAGRGFTQSDSLDSIPVAVVSEGFVAHYFPDRNPIGHRIRLGGTNSKDPWLTIVGVARETNYSMWLPNQEAAVYMNTAQLPLTGMTYLLTTRGDPAGLAPAAHKALASLDPALPLDGVETWKQSIHEELTGLMHAAGMLGLDAVFALLLAVIGIFGVMADLVGERTREIGVRLALGAQRGNVLGLILRRASWLTGAGITIGLVLAFVLAHLVANLLRGVRPDDPVVFTVITVTIAAAALGSSWIPARRAARVDPMQALRAE
jgi:putative ABC transport system permease protein